MLHGNLPAVYFYSARVRRSRGASWSSFSPALTDLMLGEHQSTRVFPEFLYVFKFGLLPNHFVSDDDIFIVFLLAD